MNPFQIINPIQDLNSIITIKCATKIINVIQDSFTTIKCATKIIKCDSPRPWGLYFQDASSPQMEAIIELHNYVMYYLIGILLAVI
jgi:hypothetical protein